MSGLSELGKVLHEEHFRILVLVCGLENRVTGEEGKTPLDPAKLEDREQLEELITSLDQVIDHNAFEEVVLFPMLSDGGEGELAVLLTQEHVLIGPAAKRLRLIAGDILKQGTTDKRWQAFRTAAHELVAAMMPHLQKEELSVVQCLERFLDPETDHRLACKHAAERTRTFTRPLRKTA